MTIRSTLWHTVRALRHLPRDLLRRVLEMHRTALAAVGLQLEDLVDNKALWNARDRLPEALLDTLDHLYRMSSAAGFAQLSRVLREHGQRVSRRVRPIQLALQTLIEHRSWFFQAFARSHPPPPAFREFVGRGAQTALTEAGLQRLQSQLDALFEDRGGCWLNHWVERGMPHFFVGYAGCVQNTHDVQGERIVSIEWQSEQGDLLALGPRLNRLYIGDCEPALQQGYLEAFGVMLANDPEWFHEADVIDLMALVQQGERALMHIPGLVAVRLTRFEVRPPGSPGFTQVASGPQACILLRDLHRSFTREDVPVSATFSLQHASDGHWREVTVRAPDHLETHWHGDHLARQFLEQRGLLRIPC